MEEIKKYLIEFVNNPYDSKINFNLGYAYEKEKQYASAFSYYLRCAEFTEDKVLASEALLRCSLCLNNQGGRDQKELHFIEHSISTSPNSLEPYLLASRFYSWRSGNTPENRHWLKSYMYACMGINILENNIQERRFYMDVGYKNYELYNQKAFAGTNIGKIDEVREIYIKILLSFDISDNTKSFIKNKLNELPEPQHPIISYSKNNLDNLKLIFNNSDKIDVNYSQIYQDIFVLSMNNGKMNGTYLEIGAGDYKYGNNTYLLESEFKWTGISLDYNQNFVNNFNENRNNNCICSDATTIDYLELLKNNYKSTNIDYLQLDCDPPNITFDILTKIPFDKYKFGVITYEHDYYNDVTGSYREKSREFLKEKGYKLIAGNISPYGDKCPFEDWWIHPEVIDENIWKLFERDNDEPINGEKYMLTKSEILNNNMISINRHVETKTIKEDLILSNTILDNFQIKNKEILNLNNLHAQWYENLSGINEYRLYSYLSTLFNNIVILDIGTGFGISAVALSHNENNHVISYNLIDQIGDNSKIYTKKNITFKIKNVLEDLTEDFIKNIKIIMIDIDHFGEEERKIIDTLEELNYSGIVILDDIHHPWKKEGKCMKELWESINYTKYDITKYGHNSGTGIFFMNFNINIIQETSLENNIKYLYDFVPCHDQTGNDLFRVDISNIESTLKKVASSPEIQGVNTQGYVKNKVDKIEQINDWWYPNDGIYIKKPVNDYLKQISQRSIPVFGTLVCTTTKWLIKQLESIDYPIENFIIINNNSKVLAKELDTIVKKQYKFIKNLKVYHMPYNLGCAEGWNMIIKSFMFSPYWIISNDDVSFGPGVLKNMNLAAQNPEVGLVHKNPVLLPKLEKFGTFELFLIKDWVIQKYGLFDSNFYPAYYEDTDYLMRLINQPIKIINTIDGIIYHGDTTDYNVSGANTIKTNDKVKTRLLIAKYKNFDYFIKKWNCYPESINDINEIYKFPFNDKRTSYTNFDIDFAREKHLLDTLDKLDTLDCTNLSVNNNISLTIENKLFLKQNLIVIDNFYNDPDEIREYALSLDYQSPENHGAVGYRCESGRKILDGTKELFEKLLHSNIPDGNNVGEWNYSTNGCFQWCNASVPIVYHCDSQKYAGIIYLTPDAPPNCGTSFFRHKKYKLRNGEIFGKNDWYDSSLKYKEPHLDKTQWEVVDSIGNVYNRLIIFDAQYIHAVSEYFGEDINNSRLFQLFFFNTT